MIPMASIARRCPGKIWLQFFLFHDLVMNADSGICLGEKSAATLE